MINHSFLPGTMDPGFQIWAMNCISSIADLMDGPNLKSFDQLFTTCNIHRHDFFVVGDIGK